jgi:hypothetical protein
MLLILIYKSFPHAQSNQCPLYTARPLILIQAMSRPDVSLNDIDILLDVYVNEVRFKSNLIIF